MRILITSPVFPPDLGGPSVYVPSLARYLISQGHEVKVVAFCADTDPQGYPFEVIAIPRGPLPIRYLKAFFAVLREAKGQDVVYIQEHLALLHVWAARLRRVPAVIRMMVDGAWEISHRKGWIDGDDIVTFETKEYDWRVKLVRALQKHWWKGTRRLIACSEFLRQIAVKRYGMPEDWAVKIFNAYHGPERVDEDRAAAREKLGLDPQRRYVLTICRLMVWKGVDGIIRAIRELGDDVHLLVAGDGDMEEAWKALSVELGLAERVTFLGNVPHSDIPLYIRAAEAFILNSEYEGLSHTLLEVINLGTPIVCTGVCGNPEVVEDGVNGILVQPKDDENLSRAIASLLEDSEKSLRYGRAALERAHQFTRETTFPQVERVLAEAAGQSR